MLNSFVLSGVVTNKYVKNGFVETHYLVVSGFPVLVSPKAYKTIHVLDGVTLHGMMMCSPNSSEVTLCSCAVAKVDSDSVE